MKREVSREEWQKLEREIDGFRERLKILRKRKVRNDEWFQKRQNDLVDADMHLTTRNYVKLLGVMRKLRKVLCNAEDVAYQKAMSGKRAIFTRKGTRYIG